MTFNITFYLLTLGNVVGELNIISWTSYREVYT